MAWLLDWLDASNIAIVEPGERFLLASGEWGVGVLDVEKRAWVKVFRGANAAERGWLLWSQHEHHGGIAFWRRANALWITLHTLLGLLAVGFVVAMVSYGVVILAGVDPERIGTHALPVMVAWLAPLGGWLGFVYLHRPLAPRVRILVGACILGVVGWLLSVGPGGLPCSSLVPC